MRRVTMALLATACASGSALAQGSLSAQGLGYPVGQLGTRAATLGGGFAELDHITPHNPAALVAWASGGLFFQSEPEYRSITADGVTDRTRTVRFPLVAAAARLRNRVVVGITASTLLDQTWSTLFEQRIAVGADSILTTSLVRSEGSVTDVRLGASWAPGTVVRFGIAGHLLSGRTRFARQVAFDDDGFIDLVRLQESTFGGKAVSAGVLVVAGGSWLFGASARAGGSFRIDSGSVTVEGDAPSRVGASAAYTGIPDASFSVNVERFGWEAMSDLAPGARNTTEIGFGAEIGGMSVLNRELLMRAGARFRGLPFPAVGSYANERTFGAGVGIGLAPDGPRGRAVLDLGILRASRSGPAGISETSWVVSAGIAIRP